VKLLVHCNYELIFQLNCPSILNQAANFKRKLLFNLDAVHLDLRAIVIGYINQQYAIQMNDLAGGTG